MRIEEDDQQNVKPVPPWRGRFSRPITRRRYALGDVHGCSRTLRRMVEEVLNLGRDDTLFLLGDYIDRGPDSRGVLDYLMTLWNDDYDIRPLMGNHEEMAVGAASGAVGRDLWYGNGGSISVEQFGVDSPEDIPRRYLDFMSRLPRILVEKDYVFVHAGLNFLARDPISETDPSFMLWERDYRFQPGKIGGRTLVCGHTMTSLAEIRTSLDLCKPVICLDNGCWSRGEIGFGNLVALNLDTRELLVLGNCE